MTNPRECEPALYCGACQRALGRERQLLEELAALRLALNDAEQRLQASRDENALLMVKGNK